MEYLCTGEKKDDVQFTNDILSMLSPEGEKVGLGKVCNTAITITFILFSRH